MSATTWLIISIVGFSLSGIALVAAAFIFFKMNIRAVIGDLSGKTVAREIKAIRAASIANANQGNSNISNSSYTNVTDNYDPTPVAHASKRLDRSDFDVSSGLNKNDSGNMASTKCKSTTESLSDNVSEVDIDQRRATSILPNNSVGTELANYETEVLEQNTVHDFYQTEVLQELNPTDVLSDAFEYKVQSGTTVLSDYAEIINEAVVPVAFNIVRSIIRIHTDEVIQVTK